MGQLFMVRRWVVLLLVSLALVLALPGLGLAAGGSPGEGPGQGPGGEGLETATQQMFESGIYGTVKVADNGDVYVVNRFGEPGAKGQIDFSKAANNGAGTEVYRIPVDKLKNATDADLDKFAKEIYGASDMVLGTETVGGQSRLMSQPENAIKDKLKKLRDAYKKGDVKFDPTVKTADQLRAALKTDPDIDAKLKGIEELKTKKVEKAPEQPKSKYGPKPLEISQPPSESTIAGGSQALPETPTTSVTPVAETKSIPNVYIDAYGGFSLGTTQTPSLYTTDSFTRGDRNDRFKTIYRTQASPNLAGAGGVSLGTWFDYACCRQRSWLKYFGFAVGYNYYGLDYSSRNAQFSKFVISRDNERNLSLDRGNNLLLDGQRNLLRDGQRNFPREGDRPLIGDGTFSSTGSVNSLAFLFKARLPLDLPSLGHWEIEGGVGPTVNFVTTQIKARLGTLQNRNGMENSDILNIDQYFKSQTVVVPGLQVSVGVKYTIFEHISVGPGFIWNYLRYSQHLTGGGGLSGEFGVTSSNFTGTMGLRYTF